MRRLDLNADLGEHDGPPPAVDRALMRVVTSANIACGWHAGDLTSMRHAIADAAARGVQVGAHPSFPDREGFGRRVLAMSPREIADAVASQVHALEAVALAEGVRVQHVKPHGALYALSLKCDVTATAIVSGVLAVDAGLAIYAPQASELARAAAAAGLRCVSEGFIDRSYEDDGTLTPREMPGAVLHDVEAARARVVAWVRDGRVRTRSGQLIEVPLETLSVHADTLDADVIARSVRDALEAEGIALLPSLAP